MQHTLMASAGRALQISTGLLPGWGRPLLSADGPFGVQEANPLQVAVDRAFGALADSLGLTSSRQALDHLRGLSEAELERQLARLEMLGIIGSAFGDAVGQAVRALAKTGRDGGDGVDSVLDLVRIWTRALDRSMHTAMRSSEGVEATARLVNVTTERQLRIEALIGLAADAVGLPSRSDLDEAYKEIQQLKRELRRLRRGEHGPGLPPSPPAETAAEPEPAATDDAAPKRRTKAEIAAGNGNGAQG